MKILIFAVFCVVARAHDLTTLDAAIYKIRNQALRGPVIGFLVRDKIPLATERLKASVWPKDTLSLEFESSFTIGSVTPIFGAGLGSTEFHILTSLEQFAKRQPHGTVVILNVSSSIVQGVAWQNLSHFIQRLRFLPREPHVDLSQLSFLIEIPSESTFSYSTTGKDLLDHGLDRERFGDTQFVFYWRTDLRDQIISNCRQVLQF